MWLYIIIFAIPLIAFLSGGGENRNKAFLSVFMTFLACFVGFSDMMGGFDRYIYGEIFDDFADEMRKNVPITETGLYEYYGTELGYIAINWIIALFTRNRYIFITIVTFIIYFNFYTAFKRHVKNYPFAFMMFFAMIFLFTFTYLRQLIGVSFALLGIKYLINGERKKFLCVICLVALFHKSGIIFGLLYFFRDKILTKNQIVWLLIICFFLGVSGISSSIYDVYIETVNLNSFAGSADNYTEDKGARFAYFIEVAFFAWLILKHYSSIEKTGENLVFLNMAILFCAVLLLFIRSENGGRLSWYFVMGVIYTISNIVDVARSGKRMLGVQRMSGSIINILILVFFVLYIRIYVGWNVVKVFYPYKTYFTNGYRIGDPVRDDYEYDFKYEEDKFYRLWSWE